ncbi:MAG: hypothetical protein RR202_12480 [Bacteroidales bacterium]
MRKERHIRLLISGILITVFLQFLAVKAFHCHSGKVRSCTSQSCCTDDHQQSEQPEQSDRDTPTSCQVCQYTLSPFIDAQPLQIVYLPKGRCFNLVIPSVGKPILASRYISLRAPPALNTYS